MDDIVYQRTKEQRDFWMEHAKLLEGQLQRLRDLPTYSISQGICIDPYAEKLLKAEQVYKIIGSAKSSPQRGDAP